MSEGCPRPVLPLRDVEDFGALTAWIRTRPVPLAVYLLAADRCAEAELLTGTRAGSLVVNGAVVQAAVGTLPRDGVRAWGFGRCH